MDLQQKLKLSIEQFTNDHGFSGTILIAKDGDALLHHAYGTANHDYGIPNKLDTKYAVASITKPITAMGIMMLAEKGLIDVHESCLRYLPMDLPIDKSVTLHHLLTHTSGIPDFETMPDFSKLGMQAYTSREIVELVSHLPYSPPGKCYKYCNTGYNLLAWIIETVTGRSYDEFVSESIFKPLDMQGTLSGYSRDIVPSLACGYSLSDEGAVVIKAPYYAIENFKGSGNLYSTAEDLLKWSRSLYSDKLISAEARNMMLTRHVPVEDARSYGYGLNIYPNSFGHNGWLPGYRSTIRHFYEKRVTLIALGNQDFVQQNDILERAFEMF